MQAATSRAPRALVAHPAVAPAAKAPIEPVIDARKEPLPSPANGLLPIPKARGGPSEAQSDPPSTAEVGPLRPAEPAPAPQVETAPLLLPELGTQSPHQPVPAAVALSPAAHAPPVPAAAPQHLRDCEECPEMMLVGAGDFLMGAVPDDPLAEAEEKPQRKVVIAAPFYIGIYEVSFDEWRACLAAGGCRGHKPADAGWGTGKRPVINVSFLDAEAYAGWLSQKTQHRYRLPSEEEWEYTARGGTIPQVPAGDSNRRDANCNGCDSKWGNRQTAPVGSFQANALGLYDMPGNVWEWTTGCWQRDEADAVPASEGRTASLGRCDERVLRGGSWANSPTMLRSSARIWGSPDGRNNNVGFRVVREHDNRF
jgi:formylglycine-generating enzyme required for sulfatase activity